MKKPAKKYRGKARKLNARKYGAFSVTRAVRTSGKVVTVAQAAGRSTSTRPSGGTSGSTLSYNPSSNNNSPWIGSLRLPVDKNVTLSYGSATIHLGQTWSTTIRNQLAAGATGGKHELASRKNIVKYYRYKTDPTYGFITNEEYSQPMNWDVYMFDIGGG